MTLRWRCHDVTQVLTLSDEVMQHVLAHRQFSASATEAGGQLFGTVDGDDVVVSLATGPYSSDERSRYKYRSNPRAAADCIKLQESKGLAYLGEWHTHAERCAKPSYEDIATMSGLSKKSTLSAGAAMLLIVGTSPMGLYLGTFEKDRFRSWVCDERGMGCFQVTRWLATRLLKK